MKLVQLLFLILLISVFCNSLLFAAYVRNHPLTLKQPDGKTLNLFATGDEFYNWVHDKDGFTIMKDSKGWYVYAQQSGTDITPTSYIVGQDDPASRGIQPWVNKSAGEIGRIRKDGYQFMTAQGTGRAPHSGTLNNIAIFIRFSDQTEFNENISTYSSMFNGTTGNNMQSYFSEASYNQLNINTNFYPIPNTMVVSWQDSHPRAYYSPYNASTNPIGYTGGSNGDDRTNREQTLLVNAVMGVRSAIPTTLNIDGDNDGSVDNVCFIIEGDSDGWAELLWPHRWSLYTQDVFINGKLVFDYNFQLSAFMAVRGVGVLCHEMFHSLGSPDLYHYTDNGMSPVGGWDLMENDADPPQHMSAFMKFKYGLWISSIPVINTAGTYTLNSLVQSTNNCYRINTSNSTSEYYVLEYRKKIGTFESSIPGSGLVVYRINTVAEGNAEGPPDEVYVYRPNGTTTSDGLVSLANFSDETGRVIFNQYTNPSPFLSTGVNGYMALSNIGSSAGTTISFNFNTSVTLPTVVENFETGFTSLPWTFSGNANWAINTAQHYNGVKCAKSGSIASNQSSVMQANITSAAGQVTFFYKISSEANYDYLKFYIDGVQKGQWSGEGNWAMASYNLTAGDHILKWVYSKSASGVSGSDCAWVDYIAYPAVFNPPTNFTAVAGNTWASLTWSAPASGLPAGYKIYRNGALYQTISNPATHQYLDTNVMPGNYLYKVTCYYTTPVGESVFSNEVSVTIQPFVFNPPTNLTATPGVGSVTLNWQEPTMLEGYLGGNYKIYRDSAFLVDVSSMFLTYVDHAVMNDVSYSYYVTAQYASPVGESGPSNIVSATPITPEFDPPINLNAVPLNWNQILLTWLLPETVLPGKSLGREGEPPSRSLAGVKIYKNSSLIQTITDPTAVTYVDLANTPGTFVYYVTCFYTNPNGESIPSNSVEIYLPPYEFNPPTNLTAVAGDAIVTLTWEPPLDVVPIGYRLFRNGQFIPGLVITDTTYTDTSVTNGISYTYCVTALYQDPTGESAPTESITVTPTAPILVPPSNLEANVSGSNAHLSWSLQIPTEMSITQSDLNNRALVGFKIYLNNVVYATLTPTVFEYDIMNLPNGTSTVGVTAAYTNGESAPAIITIVGNHDPSAHITTALNGNFPNPFNPTTSISYSINTPGAVTLEIYNSHGQKVRVLVDSQVSAGNHTTTWDGKDEKGNVLGSGLYFYKMKSGNFTSTRKMILLK